ncbi:MAG: helix-turn-helix transcriptional regulator [Acidimicrobiia bacterium]
MSETTARLLSVLSRLQSGAASTGPELADWLDVTVRTIRRDVERLRELGYAIESQPGTVGGYRLGRGGTVVPPLMLDEEEAVAVAVCLRAAAGGSVIGVEDAAGRVLSRLEQMLPTRLRPHVAALSSATTRIRSVGEEVHRDVLVAVSRACRERDELVLCYRDARGRESERRVEPYRVVNAGRRWYLAAHDVERREWRTFRMDRITSATVTGHRFELEDPPDATALVHAAITSGPYRYQAKIEFAAPLADLAELIPATVGILEAVDDNTTILLTGANDLDDLATHIVVVGAGFVVHDPPELRARIAQLAALLGAGSVRPTDP